MTKQVIIAAGDGDDGSGKARIIDAATGLLLRDIPRPHVTTDAIQSHATYGDYYYLRDFDSTIACFDKDNVFVSRVDMDYYANPSQHIWANAAGIHCLKLNREFTTIPAGVDQLYKIVTYAHVTLAKVSEVLLNAPELGDAGLNLGYVHRDRIFLPTATDFWVFSTSPTFTSGQGFVKVSIANGTVLDTWEDTNVLDVSLIRRSVEGVYWYNGDAYVFNAFTWRTLDFSTKTISAVSTPCDLDAAFLSNAPGNVGNPAGGPVGLIGVSEASLVGNTMRLIYSYNSGNDPAFPAANGFVKGAAAFTITEAGSVTVNYITPIRRYDYAKVTANFGNRYSTASLAVPVSATDWVVGDKHTLVRLSATGTILWTFANPFDASQGYSSDGENLNYLVAETWSEFTLAGTVTDGAGVNGRKVRVHDQRTGEVVNEVLTDGGGAYTVSTFAATTKYLVCESVNSTKNFEINAYIIPE